MESVIYCICLAGWGHSRLSNLLLLTVTLFAACLSLHTVVGSSPIPKHDRCFSAYLINYIMVLWYIPFFDYF